MSARCSSTPLLLLTICDYLVALWIPWSDMDAILCFQVDIHQHTAYQKCCMSSLAFSIFPGNPRSHLYSTSRLCLLTPDWHCRGIGINSFHESATWHPCLSAFKHALKRESRGSAPHCMLPGQTCGEKDAFEGDLIGCSRGWKYLAHFCTMPWRIVCSLIQPSWCQFTPTQRGKLGWRVCFDTCLMNKLRLGCPPGKKLPFRTQSTISCSLRTIRHHLVTLTSGVTFKSVEDHGLGRVWYLWTKVHSIHWKKFRQIQSVE